ncbi:hypothetical protein SNE35_19745 [Paucibacter sp. R3-3]|uniref:FAD/NAD(P)-binding domain-containing protein n=1 Tax=Roseateles agri TaxID=3098619 RepID=A0ABU5DKB5_9BURK|nr:hypothetical protein [Paucibacter sp. R3-3]MDY0746755.1 hypothetical protein [Paucibacter sp. R3-3]
MSDACDVLVIGAGCAGIQAACAAASESAHVLVLDGLELDGLQAPMQDAAAWNPWLSDAQSPGCRLIGWRPGHTALELLLDASGAVRGAAGVAGEDETPWRIAASTVVIASAQTLLMAAEAGADLCGMEAGHGGLRICGYANGGASSVEGLYAASPAAWSVLASGAGLPRGTQAHALLSGQQAGAAAAHESAMRQRPFAAALEPAGCAGLRGSGHRPANPMATLAAVQAVRRSLGTASPDDARASEALERLDALWLFICNAAPAARGALCATRAAACQVALARWQLRSLLARRASEAEHLARECVVARGVDQVCTSTELRESLAVASRRSSTPLPLFAS